MKTLIERIEQRSRPWKITTALVLTLTIGVIDWVVTPQVSFTIFYLVPVCLASWYIGTRFGVVVSFFSDLSCVVDVYISWRRSDSLWMIHGWNTTVRLAFFLIFVWLLQALRSLQEQLEDKVRERTVALTAEIAERRRLEKELLETTENERQRIGRELHDGPCQQLMAAAMACSALQRKLGVRLPAESGEAGEIVQVVRQAIVECRQVMQGLFPSALETGGLSSALAQLVSMGGAQLLPLPVSFTATRRSRS